MTCGYCDRANTRCALLAMALRKLGVWVHLELKHPPSWKFDRCALEPCTLIAAALQGVKLTPETP